jgi:AcrR family transcriptional regulator
MRENNVVPDEAARKNPATSIRARVRAEMTEEIKSVALRHLATDGTALSLRAVARDMGMVSSALYRYFANRDELLTALILDAYNAMGEVTENADATFADREDFVGRWMALGHAVRDWAVAQPHEYALIYGSPIPGYQAPETTIDPATRPLLVLARILADAHATGALSDSGAAAITPAALTTEIERISELLGAGIGVQPAARALAAWTELYGAISFELFGRLNNVFADPASWFDWQLRSMAGFIGLPAAR